MQDFSIKNIFGLMSAHCAGMVDLVALPIWIGVLVSFYHFDFQNAGLLVTLFLLGVTLASCIFSPKFNRLQIRKWVIAGYGCAFLIFLLCFFQTSFLLFVALHFLAGMSVGTSLSLTHGTVGKSRNPHRLFALLGMALGVFSIVFMAGATQILQHYRGAYFFLVLALVMGCASVATFIFFPKNIISNTLTDHIHKTVGKLSLNTWLVIFGVSLLSMTQALVLSFFERVGTFRGFSAKQIATALVVYTIVSLIPAPVAAFLQKRVNKFVVICFGPVLQAISALCIYQTHQFIVFTIFGSCMIFSILFIHTFAFGLLAELDPSGRAVSATPAMLMFGSAVGPLMGGALVKFWGFEAIGYMAVVLVALQIILFNISRLRSKATEQQILVNDSV